MLEEARDGEEREKSELSEEGVQKMSKQRDRVRMRWKRNYRRESGDEEGEMTRQARRAETGRRKRSWWKKRMWWRKKQRNNRKGRRRTGMRRVEVD